MATRTLDWLVTLPFLLVFGSILLIFDPLQRVARLFGQRPQEWTAGCLQVCLVRALRITGTRVEVERSPRVASHTPYLVMANHQSIFDIPILGAALFSNYPKYVSKRSLAKWIPSISYNLRRGGNALIDRSDRGQATAAIRDLGAQVVARGVSAVLYPEGTRARKGDLGPFKPAGALALLGAAPKVAVLPVTIDQSWRLLEHNLFPIPAGIRIRVRIGDPIERHEHEDPPGILLEVRRQMEKSLADWRSGI